MTEYRFIFIVDSIKWWDWIGENIDAKRDLVLTFDFALKVLLESKGVTVHYVDRLVESQTMHENNFIVYDFFKKWHYDSNGKDIFLYKNIPFGFSLRLEIWNDLTEFVRLYLCLSSLKSINHKNLYVATQSPYIVPALNKLNLNFTLLEKQLAEKESFYFPISKWMDEQIRPSGLRRVKRLVLEKLVYLYSKTSAIYDRYFSKYENNIFIQEYHPTRALVTKLKQNKKNKIILGQIARRNNIFEYLDEHHIPIYGSIEEYEKIAHEMIGNLFLHKANTLRLSDGSDITQEIFDIIGKRLKPRLSTTLRTLDCAIEYIENNTIDLVVLIANMGHLATLVDCVCKTKHIPSHLIINGLMAAPYLDEAKYANTINAYSQSIKDNYFKGMENIVILGDPRMDIYASCKHKIINRKNPTVTIGTSGFNNANLSSYLAVEFEFINDILLAFKHINDSGINIIIKVRPNGYKHQYAAFVNSYYPTLSVTIEDRVSMIDVLHKSDLYISIYSQTLFEASCLGIPVIYYKKDDEVLYPPFDGKSELVTLSTVNDLVKAYDDFKVSHARYDSFLDQKIMEKYIGFLDGNNLERNMNYVYELLKGKANENDS